MQLSDRARRAQFGDPAFFLEKPAAISAVMCVSILDSRSFSSASTAGHSRLIGRQFLPTLLSLPGFRIGMIIA